MRRALAVATLLVGGCASAPPRGAVSTVPPTLTVECYPASPRNRMLLTYTVPGGQPDTLESPEWVRFQQQQFQCFEGYLWARHETVS